MGRNNSFFVVFAAAILLIAAIGAAVAVANTNSNSKPAPQPEPVPEEIEECIAIAFASYTEARANYEVALANYNGMGASDSKKYCGTSVGAASIQMYASIKSTIKVLDTFETLMTDTTKGKADLTTAIANYSNTAMDAYNKYNNAVNAGKISDEVAKAFQSDKVWNILNNVSDLSKWADEFKMNIDNQNDIIAEYSKALNSIKNIFKQIENEIDQSKKAVASKDFGTVVSINEKIDEQIKESMEIAKTMPEIPAKFIELYDSTIYNKTNPILTEANDHCKKIEDILDEFKCTEEVRQIFAEMVEQTSQLPSTIDTVYKLESTNAKTIKKSIDSIDTHIAVTLKVVSLSESVNVGMTKAFDSISEPVVVIETKLADLKKISDAAESAYEAATEATTVDEAMEAAEEAYDLAVESDEMAEGIGQGLEELQPLVDGVNAELVKASATIEEMEKLTE